VLIVDENMVESVDNPADEMLLAITDIVAVLIVDENIVESVDNPADEMLFTINVNSNLNSWSAGRFSEKSITE
jgi:hypothetical protein